MSTTDKITSYESTPLLQKVADGPYKNSYVRTAALVAFCVTVGALAAVTTTRPDIISSMGSVDVVNADATSTGNVHLNADADEEDQQDLDEAGTLGGWFKKQKQKFKDNRQKFKDNRREWVYNRYAKKAVKPEGRSGTKSKYVAPAPDKSFPSSFNDVNSAAEFLTMNRADVMKMLSKLALATYYPYTGRKLENKIFQNPATDYDICYGKLERPVSSAETPWFDERLSNTDRGKCGDAPPKFKFMGHIQSKKAEDGKLLSFTGDGSMNMFLKENADADIYHSTYGHDEVCLVSIRGTDTMAEPLNQIGDVASDISVTYQTVYCDGASVHCNNLQLPSQDTCIGGVYTLQSKRRKVDYVAGSCGVVNDEGQLKCGDKIEFVEEGRLVELRGDEKAAGRELLIRKSGDKYTLTSRGGNIRGKYCGDEGNGIICNRDAAYGWELFDIEPTGDGYFALKGGNQGKYCADEDSGDIVCNRDSSDGEWEKFKLECAGAPQREISRGLSQYYKSLRGKIQQACRGKTIVATGHSLGAAAAQVMHAHGDSALSIAFAPVKVFKAEGCAPERTMFFWKKDADKLRYQNFKNKQMKNMFTIHTRRKAPKGINHYDIVPSIFDAMNANSQCGEQNYELLMDIPCSKKNFLGVCTDGDQELDSHLRNANNYFLHEEDNLTPSSNIMKLATTIWRRGVDMHMMYVSYIPYAHMLPASQTDKLHWQVDV